MIRAGNLRELQAKMTNALDRLAGQMASGAIIPAEFVVKADSLLQFSHARAAVLGTGRAKRTGDFIIANRVAAQAREEQREFLIGFARDLAAGKYAPKRDGGRGARQRMTRFALYSLRLAGTSNLAWKETLLAQNPVTEALWIRHANESCGDCRVQAGYGWRPLRSFPFMPGMGRTQCIVRCKCTVTTREGNSSYVL